ncbi:MAG: hypothetical protein JW909_13450 [Planctomycetes bacterium]|nr:hypothetical protein [Planctomycetota bacterium]
MKWSCLFDAPSLILAPADGGFSGHIALGPDEAGRSADVLLTEVAGTFRLDARVAGRPAAVRPDHPEWYNRAHMALMLNPEHDHCTRWMYAVSDTGSAVGSAAWTAPGEEPGDVPSHPLAAPPAARSSFEWLGDSGYRISLEIPSEALWKAPGTPAGMRIKLGFHEETIVDPLTWPVDPGAASDVPLLFADVYLGKPPLNMKLVEFPQPAWGGAPGAVRLQGILAPGAASSGTVNVTAILPEDSEIPQPPQEWKAERGAFRFDGDVLFHHRAKWSNSLLLTARVRLEVKDADGGSLWLAEYPFGFDCGIIVREKYGAAAGPAVDRPAPQDANFVDRYRQYILSRLPDYRRMTTRDGAPSDFYLADAAGGADLDLSAEDPLGSAAAMLAARFHDWQDALCAAAMWVYHPCITRHSSTWHRISGYATLPTIMRLGGCFCGDTSRLLASLAEKTGAILGVPLKGWTMGLRGHLITLVEAPVGRVVLDGMLGLWFHTLDNSRLATLEEMRGTREIVHRMWYCPRAHGHEFFHGNPDQIIRQWEEGSLAWP